MDVLLRTSVPSSQRAASASAGVGSVSSARNNSGDVKVSEKCVWVRFALGTNEIIDDGGYDSRSIKVVSKPDIAPPCSSAGDALGKRKGGAVAGPSKRIRNVVDTHVLPGVELGMELLITNLKVVKEYNRSLSSYHIPVLASSKGSSSQCLDKLNANSDAATSHLFCYIVPSLRLFLIEQHWRFQELSLGVLRSTKSNTAICKTFSEYVVGVEFSVDVYLLDWYILEDSQNCNVSDGSAANTPNSIICTLVLVVCDESHVGLVIHYSLPRSTIKSLLWLKAVPLMPQSDNSFTNANVSECNLEPVKLRVNSISFQSYDSQFDIIISNRREHSMIEQISMDGDEQARRNVLDIISGERRRYRALLGNNALFEPSDGIGRESCVRRTLYDVRLSRALVNLSGSASRCASDVLGRLHTTDEFVHMHIPETEIAEAVTEQLVVQESLLTNLLPLLTSDDNDCQYDIVVANCKAGNVTSPSLCDRIIWIQLLDSKEISRRRTAICNLF